MNRRPREFLVVGLFFVLLSGLYLGANIFAGEIVAPMDLLFHYAGWQDSAPTLALHSIGRSDVIDSLLPGWIFLREDLARGQLALWYPMSAGGGPGFPFPAYISVGFLLFLLFGGGIGFTLGLWAHLVIAAFGAYLLCRTRLKVLPSMFGGITYMMCGFNSSWLMVNAVESSMWVPWVLWAIIRLDEKPNTYRGTMLAAVVSMMIFAGFPAVAGYALYASMLLGLWLLGTRILREHRLDFAARRGVWILSFWLLGIALASIEVFPFAEYIQQFNTSWRVYHGLPLSKSVLLLFPFLDGPPSVEYTGYAGIIAISLAALAVLYSLSRRRNHGPLSPKLWAFLAAITLVIIYNSPTSLAGLFYQLPVFNDNPQGRMLLLLGLELAILGAVGFQTLSEILEKLSARSRSTQWKWIKIVLLLGIIALQATDLSRVGQAQNTVVPADTFFPVTPTIRFVSEHLQPGQSVLATVDSYGISGSLGAYGISEWFAHDYHTDQEKAVLSHIVTNAWETPTSAAFSFDKIDLQSPYADALGIRYILTSVMSTAEYQQCLNDRPSPPMPQNTVGQVVQFSETYSVIGMNLLMATYTRPTAGADVVLTLIDAYGEKLAASLVKGNAITDNQWVDFRFDQVLDLRPGTYSFEVQLVGTPAGPVSVWSLSQNGFTKGNMTVNGKPAPGSLTFQLMGMPKRLLQGWTLHAPGDRVIVLEHESTPPGAYVLSENVSWDQADPRSWTSENTSVVSYDANHQVFRVETERSAWLVRIARDWPGWVAYVNGKVTESRRYLGILPAVHLERGISTVEWRYEPWSVKIGAAISSITFVLLSLVCLLPVLKRRPWKD